jgi:uncharacterized membrane protein
LPETNRVANYYLDESERHSLMRLILIMVSVSLLTLSYAVWSLGAYVNLWADVLQWILIILGGAVLFSALVIRNVGHRLLVAIGLFVFSCGLILYFIMVGAAIIISYTPFGLIFGGLILISLSMKNGERTKLKSIVEWLVVAAMEAMLLVWSLWLSGQIQPIFILLFAFIGVFIIISRIFEWKLVAPAFIGACCLFAAVAYYITPDFGTDALLLTTYAAHLILSGINPYISGAMSGAFSYYHIVSAQYLTPLTNGGVVDWNSYTAFALYISIPALIFGAAPKLIYGLFAIATITVVYSYYHKSEITRAAALLIFGMAGFLVFPFAGITDIVSVFFLMISFMFIKNHTNASAVCFGFALASKQTAFLILPFYIYFVYRERGKQIISYFVVTAATFIILNLPFIFTNPQQWTFSFTTPELDLLLPVGQGVNILSFVGFYNLPRIYYVINELVIFLMLGALYVLEYNRLKYSFVAFPIFMLIFNSRLLFNYLSIWPILAIAFLDIRIGAFHINKKRTAAIICAMILFPVGTAIVTHQPQQNIITGVTGTISRGFVTNLTIYTTQPCSVPLHFRIFAAAQPFITNGNIWNGTCDDESDGGGVYNLTPVVSANFSVPFVVEAYNSNVSSTFTVNTTKNFVQTSWENPVVLP